MSNELWSTVPLLIVVLYSVAEVFCTDGIFTKSITNNTVWQRTQYHQPLPPKNGPPWSHQVQVTTTPWPRLGNGRYPSTSLQNIAPNASVWTRHNSVPNLSWNRPFSPGPRSEINVAPTSEKTTEYRFDEVEIMSSGDATDDELRQFSEMLLNRDVNNAAKYVEAKYQGRTTSWSKNDEAPQPLLKVKAEVYEIPTVVKLKKLHDNYVVEVNVDEDYTPEERMEENEFVEAVASTPVMQLAKKFLAKKGKIADDSNAFKNLLRQIWFGMYSRGGNRVGSSGFEHVFAAEIKKGQVSGFHNWLYFGEEEAKQRANYLGYMKILPFADKGAIVKLHFIYNGVDKPVGSMFVGTSPEFEMALYTTCFVLRADRVCPLKLDDKRFIIRTFTYRYRGQKMIGSAFPEI